MRQHRFLLYPAGAPGAGLLIMRISVTAFLLHRAVTGFPPATPAAVALSLLACLVAVGLFMRTGACCAAIAAGLMAYGENSWLTNGLLANLLDASVLAIVGPGAFSLDANLFGRKTVRLTG